MKSAGVTLYSILAIFFGVLAGIYILVGLLSGLSDTPTPSIFEYLVVALPLILISALSAKRASNIRNEEKRKLEVAAKADVYKENTKIQGKNY